MGTKGKKNVPITARVNAGLFNQKKGITEPLLNVGPAGVYGDNQTKDIPSPSKKRGYSMAKKKVDSPIKQVNTNVITLGEDTEGTEGTEDKKVYTPPTRTPEGDAAYAKLTQAEKDAQDAKYIEKNTKIIPGNQGSDPVEGVDEVDSIPLQTRDTNDAMSPWRVRQQSRSIKKSGKDVRQAQNKLDATNRKLKKLKDAGITSGRKFDRLNAKFTENTNELDAFNKNMTARTRQVEMSSDPLGKNGTFESVDRDFTRGEMDTNIGGEQDKRNEAQIKADRIKAAAAAKAAAAKAAADAKAVKASSDPNPPGPTKTANSFFKSRSPMKKNYFK